MTMMKKLSMLSLIVFGIFMLSIKSALADIINIKTDAPQTYVVEKGDTLWDISNLFLDQPWLWPELWRNNTQIENPHLIYPGDVLRLRYVDGQPVMEIVRDKKSLSLSPESVTRTKPSPIGVLPWKVLGPYFKNDSIIDLEAYDALPRLLGDSEGTTTFVKKDFVLSHKPVNADTNYTIIRKSKLLKDEEGTVIGYQVKNVGEVELMNSGSGKQQIVRLVKSNREARPGDKLRPVESIDTSDLILQASTTQMGRIIANIEDRSLIGKRDVVVISLGAADVKPGMVMGIYAQGPAIMDSEKPRYELGQSVVKELFSASERVEQPAFKIGELIIFKTFDNASYAWITQADKHMQGGEYLGKP
ncbi:Peptidoglycan-binding LysM [Glaciecola nitratireducens FR1064]|uniref:Peptidoglycan-binding LysM n=2 Tax=Brumicola TaxID=3160924 RepID=G4QEF4_GLANF|nr:Peptidoglycan-binding LysM [Glaciecola nitratireducens FR1064]